MNYNAPTDRLLQILVALGQSGEAISAKELSEQLAQPLLVGASARVDQFNVAASSMYHWRALSLSTRSNCLP